MVSGFFKHGGFADQTSIKLSVILNRAARLLSDELIRKLHVPQNRFCNKLLVTFEAFLGRWRFDQIQMRSQIFEAERIFLFRKRIDDVMITRSWWPTAWCRASSGRRIFKSELGTYFTFQDNCGFFSVAKKALFSSEAAVSKALLVAWDALGNFTFPKI